MKEQLFNFDDHAIKGFIQYEMKLTQQMERSFEYVHEMLTKLKCHKKMTLTSKIKLEKMKFSEGKNYDWRAITCGKVELLIRTYGGHHTIFTKNTVIHKLTSGRNYERSRYGAFTFFTNTEHLDGKQSDFYCENNFHDLNEAMPQIIKFVGEDHVHCLWNSVSFIRPKHVEVKIVFHGESLDSIDKLIYCAEELSNKHMELFAENNMLEILKGLKDAVGKPFGDRHTIKRIVTEFPKQYSDPYYHGVGILTVDEKGKEDFRDVYYLGRWSTDEMEELMKS